MRQLHEKRKREWMICSQSHEKYMYIRQWMFKDMSEDIEAQRRNQPYRTSGNAKEVGIHRGCLYDSHLHVSIVLTIGH